MLSSTWMRRSAFEISAIIHSLLRLWRRKMAVVVPGWMCTCRPSNRAWRVSSPPTHVVRPGSGRWCSCPYPRLPVQSLTRHPITEYEIAYKW
eukprot:2804293-Rhodomonas_salina.1